MNEEQMIRAEAIKTAAITMGPQGFNRPDTEIMDDLIRKAEQIAAYIQHGQTGQSR